MKSEDITAGREYILRSGRKVVIVRRLGMSRRQSCYECRETATGAVINVRAIEITRRTGEHEQRDYEARLVAQIHLGLRFLRNLQTELEAVASLAEQAEQWLKGNFRSASDARDRRLAAVDASVIRLAAAATRGQGLRDALRLVLRSMDEPARPVRPQATVAH